MKIVLIVMYFGSLPEYFQLFLKSCERNKNFTWFIFTDDETSYEYPDNVKKINMTFKECKELFKNSFDFNILLDNPQKLCDFKCAYGYVLKDYLKDFDYWGHCDLDQIFGNLEVFITDEILNKYDKLYTLGHLTLYRNDEVINKQFMNRFRGIERYKEVFSDNKGHGFDEWIDGNINQIFYNTKYSFLDTAIGADIDPYSTTFRLTWYDKNNKKYFRDDIKNNIFKWEYGSLFRYYEQSNNIIKEEFPYIHLQKRKMSVCSDCINSQQFFILPNKFDSKNYELKKIFKRYKIYNLLNYQYFIVKYKNLKLRIKSRNFIFNNVFK